MWLTGFANWALHNWTFEFSSEKSRKALKRLVQMLW